MRKALGGYLEKCVNHSLLLPPVHVSLLMADAWRRFGARPGITLESLVADDDTAFGNSQLKLFVKATGADFGLNIANRPALGRSGAVLAVEETSLKP